MKIIFSWLKIFFKIDCSAQLLAEILSRIGLEVDQIVNYNILLDNCIICKILVDKKHPNNAQSKIYLVDTGYKTMQIVSTNLFINLNSLLVFVPVNTNLVKINRIIKQTKITNVNSFGMLCSNSAIILENCKSNDFIEIKNQYIEKGSLYVDFLAINDIVFDINITPNRGDCLSIYGIIKDLYAFGKWKMTSQYLQFFYRANYKRDIEYHFFNYEVLDNCQEMTFTVINKVNNFCNFNKIVKVFQYLNSLEYITIVGISNFSMLEFGRPNFIYDVDKIVGSVFLRYSKKNEFFVSISETKYTLPQGILVIADEVKIISIAGIIESKLTKVTNRTENILIEIADFNQIMIYKTSKLLKICTESSHRFERRINFGISSQFVDSISERIFYFCGGEKLKSNIFYGGKRLYIDKIYFKVHDARIFFGSDFYFSKGHFVFEKLGFKLKNCCYYIPILRQGDIVDATCLLEEYIRIVGLNSLTINSFAKKNKIQYQYPNLFSIIINRLLARGISEQISWSFNSSKQNKLFGSNDSILIKNAISKTFSTMRRNLLPNLIAIVVDNVARFSESISYFELGKVFYILRNKLYEENNLTILRYGLASNKSVFTSKRKYDFYDLKDDLYSIFDELKININELMLYDNTNAYYHPGKSSSIYLNNNIIAHIGEIHPNIIKKFKLKFSIIAAELFLDKIPKKNLDKKDILYINNRQIIKRDFAFIFCSKVKANEIIKVINSLGIDSIINVNIFDVFYHRDNKDRKSIAFSIFIQPKNKAMTKNDINKISDKIISVIKDNFQGELR